MEELKPSVVTNLPLIRWSSFYRTVCQNCTADSKIKGVDSEVHLCLHISKSPKSLFTAQQQFLQLFSAFFLTCAVVNTLQKKKDVQEKGKFQTLAPQTCHVTLATTQMPLGTTIAQVCFSSDSILITFSVTSGYHQYLSCLNLTTVSLFLSLSQNKG